MRFYAGCLALTPVLTAMAAVAIPSNVNACGGTFCEPTAPTPNGPQAMPVNQTAETVLFVMDGTEVEAHIRIEYDPQSQAGRFAWLIPVSALPEFSVGSEALFETVLAQTAPRIGFEAKEWPDCPCEIIEDDDWGDDGGQFLGAFDTPPALEPPAEPEPVAQVDVGAFQATVLDASKVDGLMTWLGDNGFEQDPDAAPILAEYIDKGHLFIALELQTDASPGEVHPITLRYAGIEPCVPIKLTAIAAEPDMAIRVLFLGTGRAAPSNYRSITLNPLVLDWRRLGADYEEVVTQAIDEAGGQAWLTEYAQDEPLSGDGLLNGAWSGQDYAGLAAPQVSSELVADGLITFWSPGDPSTPEALAHPVVGGLLEKYLPAPEDVNPLLYWSCIECYEDQADFSAWDPVAFAADFEERIVEPAAHAEDLLATWPYVTRMFTTMSPHEMTLDPTFHVNPDLQQTRFGGTAEHRQLCFKGTEMTVPGWPDPIELISDGYDPSGLPFTWTIERLPMAGPPQVEQDNTQAIAQWLDEWNAAAGDPGLCGDPDDGGNEDGGASEGGGDDEGATTGSASGSSSGLTREGTGCGCRSSGPAAPAGLFVALGLLGLARRRRVA